jgi:hypothetical protein
MVVPTPRSKVNLSILVVDAVFLLAPSTWNAAIGIEYQVSVSGWPLSAAVYRMRNIYGFKPMMERHA